MWLFQYWNKLAFPIPISIYHIVIVDIPSSTHVCGKSGLPCLQKRPLLSLSFYKTPARLWMIQGRILWCVLRFSLWLWCPIAFCIFSTPGCYAPPAVLKKVVTVDGRWKKEKPSFSLKWIGSFAFGIWANDLFSSHVMLFNSGHYDPLGS